MIRLMRGCAVAGTIALLAAASAQSRARAEAPAIVSAQREAAVAAIMARAARDPGELRLFLHAMPKGGDLHDHLSGALFAEDMIDWAGRKGLCVKADTTGFTQPPCAPGTQAASLGQTAPERYGHLVDSLSTRGWQAGVDAGAVDGHDQFFATFARFDPAVEGSEAAAMVALRRQAAREGVLYLELIHNPPALLQAGLQAGLSAPAEPLDANGLDAFFAREAPHLAAMVPAMRQQIDAEEAQARTTQACGTAQAEPGCAVAVHYQAFVLRSVAPAAVFRSMILAFALADKDPRFVGVNIVAPEDWPVARADYDLHMAMFRFLEKRHPGVAVSMHAGELAFGSVPPADLADHIGKAVASGARRIGHGVDIAFEDQGRATMARMARGERARAWLCRSQGALAGEPRICVPAGRKPVERASSRFLGPCLRRRQAGCPGVPDIAGAKRKGPPPGGPRTPLCQLRDDRGQLRDRGSDRREALTGRFQTIL